MATSIRSQNPADRVAKAILGVASIAHACERCGGTFFVPQSAFQQSVSSYGVRMASASPQNFHTCAGCNEPLIPPNLQNMANKGGEREAFLESVALGKAYRQKTEVTTLIKNTASITELNALKLEVERLNEVLENVLELLAAKEDDEIPEVIESIEPEVTTEKITRKNAAKVK